MEIYSIEILEKKLTGFETQNLEKWKHVFYGEITNNFIEPLGLAAEQKMMHTYEISATNGYCLDKPLLFFVNRNNVVVIVSM